MRVEFDFDQRGPQTWDIEIETDAGHLKLSEGASKMAVNGEAAAVDDDPEYARLYRHFAALLDARKSDADLSPFRHVADAYLASGDHVWVLDNLSSGRPSNIPEDAEFSTFGAIVIPGI